MWATGGSSGGASRVSVDPHITIFFREVGGFDGDVNMYLTDSMPDRRRVVDNKPSDLQPCADGQVVADWDTKEVVCEAEART